MKVAVCDASWERLEEIESFLNDISYIRKIVLYSRMDALFDDLEIGVFFDVVLLEINWEQEQNGLDYARILKKKHPYTKIIYMNESPEEYIEEIFLHPSNLSGFILKPVKFEQLKKYIEKIQMQRLNTDEKLIVRSKGNILAIPFEDIIYLESHLHKVNIYVDSQVFQCNEQLEQIADRLNHKFIKCHKSYVVNVEQVRMLCRNEIVLKDGVKIPVSKSRSKETKDRIFAYLKLQD